VSTKYILRTGSSIESTKTLRRRENGTRRVVTRIIRKTTTLTHGEEDQGSEDMVECLQQKPLEETCYNSVNLNRPLAKPKTVRVRFI
jgi:hypothetical protein